LDGADPARTFRVVTDHYEVLQVVRTAEPEVIRAAFRALARKYHPDSGGSVATMKAINEAWAVLSDPARRAAFDSGAGVAGQGNRRTADRRRNSDRRSAAPSTGPVAGRGMRRRYTTAEGGLDFGRYAGWTIPDLAKHDPDYLEWLRRTPIGRPFSAQIDQVLAARATVTTAPPPARRGWRTHR
jgi:curved DNA-binding protein CbpA